MCTHYLSSPIGLHINYLSSRPITSVYLDILQSCICKNSEVKILALAGLRKGLLLSGLCMYLYLSRFVFVLVCICKNTGMCTLAALPQRTATPKVRVINGLGSTTTTTNYQPNPSTPFKASSFSSIRWISWSLRLSSLLSSNITLRHVPSPTIRPDKTCLFKNFRCSPLGGWLVCFHDYYDYHHSCHQTYQPLVMCTITNHHTWQDMSAQENDRDRDIWIQWYCVQFLLWSGLIEN